MILERLKYHFWGLRARLRGKRRQGQIQVHVGGQTGLFDVFERKLRSDNGIFDQNKTASCIDMIETYNLNYHFGTALVLIVRRQPSSDVISVERAQIYLERFLDDDFAITLQCITASVMLSCHEIDTSFLVDDVVDLGVGDSLLACACVRLIKAALQPERNTMVRDVRLVLKDLQGYRDAHTHG